jgi:predicted O-methyltransferase YrrM
MPTKLEMIRVGISHPVEAFGRLQVRWEIRSHPNTPTRYPDSERTATEAVHDLLGVGECDVCRGFDETWAEIEAAAPGHHGHDSGRSTAEAAWCVARHLRPERFVETGVARGYSSAAILSAMEANGTGHLWSIDYPPADVSAQGLSGSAVPAHLRHRWTYIRGRSNQKLRPLLREIDPIDVFLHDSLHNYPTMMFEFKAAYECMRPAGILMADDINENTAFLDFARQGDLSFAACSGLDKNATTGLALHD